MAEFTKGLVEQILRGDNVELAALSSRKEVTKLVKSTVRTEIAVQQVEEVIAETKKDMVVEALDGQRFDEELDLIDKLEECKDTPAGKLKASRIIAKLQSKYGYTAEQLAVIKPAEAAKAIAADEATVQQ